MDAEKKTPGDKVEDARAALRGMPYPPIDRALILLVIRAIETVARAVTEKLPRSFWDEKWEEPLTREIHTCLVNQMILNPLDTNRVLSAEFKQFFQWVSRDAAMKAHLVVHDPDSGFKEDRKDLIATDKDRRTDLTFHFARADDTMAMDVTHRSLTVEAKRVPPSPTELTDYGNQGIARFTCGLYAISERQAIMVGYLRDTAKRFPDVLETYLARKSCGWLNTDRRAYDRLHDVTLFRPVLVTRHDRKWNYPADVPGTGHQRPGHIDLYHAWIQLL